MDIYKRDSGQVMIDIEYIPTSYSVAQAEAIMLELMDALHKAYDLQWENAEATNFFELREAMWKSGGVQHTFRYDGVAFIFTLHPGIKRKDYFSVYLRRVDNPHASVDVELLPDTGMREFRKEVGQLARHILAKYPDRG